MYDGSLSGIIDRFSGHKVLTLLFATDDGVPSDLARYGEVLEEQTPKVKLRVARRAVPEVLAAILARSAVEDVSVEDPPLEEVIAEMFSLAGEQVAAADRVARVAEGVN
jgi:ABC-2 type transport system ATP-binding protein